MTLIKLALYLCLVALMYFAVKGALLNAVHVPRGKAAAIRSRPPVSALPEVVAHAGNVFRLAVEGDTPSVSAAVGACRSTGTTVAYEVVINVRMVDVICQAAAASASATPRVH